MDVYQGFDFRKFEWCPMIQTNPGPKSKSDTRLAFDLVIPDAVVDKIKGVDIELPEDATAEIVKE